MGRHRHSSPNRRLNRPARPLRALFDGRSSDLIPPLRLSFKLPPQGQPLCRLPLPPQLRALAPSRSAQNATACSSRPIARRTRSSKNSARSCGTRSRTAMSGRSWPKRSRSCWNGSASRNLQRLRHPGPLQPQDRRAVTRHAMSRLRSGVPSGSATRAAAPSSPTAAAAAIRTSSWSSTMSRAGPTRERTRSLPSPCAVARTINFARARTSARNTWPDSGELDLDRVHASRDTFLFSTQRRTELVRRLTVQGRARVARPLACSGGTAAQPSPSGRARVVALRRGHRPSKRC